MATSTPHRLVRQRRYHGEWCRDCGKRGRESEAAIQVKDADTFTREGYEFLGWARLNETDENGVKNPEVVDAEGNFINQNLTEADLWLTWDGEAYTAVNKQVRL